ncbi:SGNH/GDSL hydrolase family protein [Paractinoplanes lichenicola]|uniref:SGNH/GDSL hydrolase family protein n=1 Tax=Paractinoplanes lichenicola TaxID=2802976 RepID=A0ABS1W6G9_9ACTN|nr:SGNH/GDSL hydrolase family protein [Actinoplanes lichenicola]MBL7262283.1 SGNH/GDSL hydrolase family protein [Actinoplanes lichenicola]
MAFRATAVGALALTAIIAAPVAYARTTAQAAPKPSVKETTKQAPVPLAVGAPGQLMNQLSNGWGNATITLLGDSTGNDKSEWFYQLSKWIAERYPHYRTTYRQWDHKKQAYGAPVVFSEGNGWLTLSFYNGSVGGAKAGYPLQGNRFGKMTAQGGDLFLLSYSHNEGRATAYPTYERLADRVAALWPSPDVVPVLQNPEGSPLKGSLERYAHNVRLRGIKGLADEYGWTTIDAHRQFATDKRPLKSLVPDGIHPNAAGQALWLNAAKNAFMR